MKTKVLSTLLVLSFATGSVSHADGLKEIIGRIGGGLLGGALCNELGIGGGSGRTVAIALCAVGGSMIGGEIGQNMDEADARAFSESQRRSFEGDLNRDYEWNGRQYGSRTGIHGRVRPIGQGYHRQTREVCREYVSVTYRGNRSSETRSVVCRKSNGSFYSLEEKTLYVNGRVVEQSSTEQYGNGRRPVPPPYITPDDRPSRPVPYPGDRRGGGRGDYRCSGWDVRDLRRGDVVYTRIGQEGTYQGQNRTGREFSVLISNRFSQVVQMQDLAIQGCHMGVSSGQEVSTRYGQRGVVAGIFSNGDVAVKINRFIQVTRQDDLYF